MVGEKRAREIWFFCRQYDAATAERWGLVNKIVPAAQLLDEARAWGREVAALSPTALRFLKASFNADTAHVQGIGQLAFAGLASFSHSAEAKEGRTRLRGEAAAGFLEARQSVSFARLRSPAARSALRMPGAGESERRIALPAQAPRRARRAHQGRAADRRSRGRREDSHDDPVDQRHRLPRPRTTT